MTTRHRSSIEPKWVLVFVFFVAGAFMGGLCTYLYTNTALGCYERRDIRHSLLFPIKPIDIRAKDMNAYPVTTYFLACGTQAPYGLGPQLQT